MEKPQTEQSEQTELTRLTRRVERLEIERKALKDVLTRIMMKVHKMNKMLDVLLEDELEHLLL